MTMVCVCGQVARRACGAEDVTLPWLMVQKCSRDAAQACALTRTVALLTQPGIYHRFQRACAFVSAVAGILLLLV